MGKKSRRPKTETFHAEREIEKLRAAMEELDYQRESLMQLRMDIEREGFRRIEDMEDVELDRESIGSIIELARSMYLKNPNTSRAVDVQADYVFAQGVTVTSEDESLIGPIREFWRDTENRKSFTSHPALLELERELQITGNLFFTFHEGSPTRVRRIDIDEIHDIYCDPDDRWTPWFYKRKYRYRDQDRVEWYPSIYAPDYAFIPSTYPDYDKEKRWDIRVLHITGKRTGRMKFGVPEVFPSLSWALAYKRFLENWSTIMAAYARLAMKISGMRNKKQAAAAHSRLQSTVSPDAIIEGNPSNTAGGTFISRSGVTVEAVKTAGATTPAEEGKPLLNMVACGHGLPNTFFGDASVGNYATAKTLDRPTELKILSRQHLWAYSIQIIVVYATAAEDPESVLVKFPEILERNVTDRVRAVINALTGFGKPLNPDICPSKSFGTRLILEALKVQDVEYWIKKFSAMWDSDEVPPMPVKTAGGAEDPSQGGDVGANG